MAAVVVACGGISTSPAAADPAWLDDWQHLKGENATVGLAEAGL